jgi:hypothetical protein
MEESLGRRCRGTSGALVALVVLGTCGEGWNGTELTLTSASTARRQNKL